ncbi:MAG: shikimate kinase [Oscillospiraceae bacterium]|nr:shikimate kinase [Oscillospiraceae bacterium]
MKNIVLIGMPGCGKSAVGKLLGEMLNMPLVDTDTMVEQEQGMTIPEIFEQFGEPAFRDMESRAAKTAAVMDGAVIATGGGMVLRQENMQALSATGVVFFRDRAVEDIAGQDMTGRPLVGADTDRLYRLYEQRIGLYRTYADHIISDTQTAQQAAEQIAALYAQECEV